MPTFEASGASRADPATVWDAWTDVPAWTSSERIESAAIDGPFRPGATITSKSKGLPQSRMRVTRTERPRVWSDEMSSLGMRLTVDHIVEPSAEGSVLTARAEISGALAFVVAPLLRRRLLTLFDASIAGVVERAERA